jgi:hypothetical protein
MPIMKEKSPILLTMKAFFAAFAAAFFSNQNPISKYEQSPTPSHPTNMTRMLSASTRSSIEAAKRLRYAKNLGYRSSPCI